MITRAYIYTLLCALLLLCALPAQAQYSREEGFDEGEWYRDFGRNSSLNKKIDALPNDAVESLPIPVMGVEVGDLTKNFGDPRGEGRTHEGLDIPAPRGTRVVSPTEAVVLRTGDGASSGINVYTANPGGETFVYMHLNSIAPSLEEGDVLERGDLIGYVGNTGNAAGGLPHLHFEIREGGEALDPYPRLTTEFTAEERAAVNGTSVSSSGSAEAPLSFSFSRDLKEGAAGEDVRALQKFLNTHGFVVAESGPGSPGLETTYFGPATKRAVIAFQRKYSISPTAGYFGPLTRGVVKGVVDNAS